MRRTHVWCTISVVAGNLGSIFIFSKWQTMIVDEILIEEVRKRPIIFNLKLDDYKNLRKKDSAWKEVATNVNADELSCRKRWKALRDCYKRCKRSSDAGTSKAKWRHMKAMSFLDNIPNANKTSRFPSDIGLSMDMSIEEETVMPQQMPVSSNSRKSKDNKFDDLLEMAASSITQACAEFTSERQEHDSTALLFLSLAKKIKEANLPLTTVTRIEAKVSNLVFSEIQALYENVKSEANVEDYLI